MKKPIFISILCILCFCFSTVWAQENEVNKAWEIIENTGVAKRKWFEEKITINRYDCTSLVMRAVGVGDDLSKEAYTSKPVFCDGREIDITKAVEWTQRLLDECIFMAHPTNYPEIAVTDAKIAYGEYVNESGEVYFNFLRNVTAAESVAFLIRCLGEKSPDLDELFFKAEEQGLVNKNDSFYYHKNETISPDEFALILSRFLKKQRSLYFSGEQHSTNQIRFSNDETGEMTYYEFLIKERVHFHFVNTKEEAIAYTKEVFEEKYGEDFVKNTVVYVSWGFGSFIVTREYKNEAFEDYGCVEIDRHTGETKWIDK